MAKFKIGDKVRRLPEYLGVLGWPHGSTVKEVMGIVSGGSHLWFDDNFSGGWWDERFELVEAAPEPVTSKAAGKVKRTSIREQVRLIIARPDVGGRVGWTGHELARHTFSHLNSVTPRLAELRREGKIKDSGQRRDKQIVWVLA